MNPLLAYPTWRAGPLLGSVLMFLMALCLTACGGGSGSDAPAATLNPPVITTQPAAATVTDGGTANFTVAATSATAPTYQWRKNGADISGATASSLTVAAPYSDNAARFAVVVTNADGSITSAEAVLTVTAVAPTINTQPLSLTVQAGGSAIFSVAVSGGTGPVAFQWRRNGVDVAGATAARYTISATAIADNAAVFTVAVVSPSGMLLSSPAMLTVSTTAQPPAITTQPVGQTVALGQAATFSVVASSSTAITYEWRRNGVAIAGATAASYTTPAATIADEAAQFAVAVTNVTGTTVSSAATLTISNLPTGVSQVSAGLRHSVAMKADGTVWSWGFTGSGLMGVGSESVTQGVPTRAKNVDGSTFTGSVGVSAGYDHTVVVKADTTVWAWGNNGGALGDGSTTSRSSPVQVKDAAGVPLTAATSVAAGQNYTLAVKSDGSVWAWGYNGYSTLGDGTSTTRLNPVQVLGSGGGGFTGVAKVAAGQYHALALKTDGTAWAWGRNAYGELGNGSTGTVALPVRVDITPGVALANVVSIAAGLGHSVAATSNGNAYAWG